MVLPGTGNLSRHNGFRQKHLLPESLPPDRFPPKLSGNLHTSYVAQKRMRAHHVYHTRARTSMRSYFDTALASTLFTRRQLVCPLVRFYAALASSFLHGV